MKIALCVMLLATLLAPNLLFAKGSVGGVRSSPSFRPSSPTRINTSPTPPKPVPAKPAQKPPVKDVPRPTMAAAAPTYSYNPFASNFILWWILFGGLDKKEKKESK